MSSKFKVNVAECTGAVVIGDHANLTIGPSVPRGEYDKFSFPLQLILPFLGSTRGRKELQ